MTLRNKNQRIFNLKKSENFFKNKKGFYFTLDALFSLTLLLVVIALIPYTKLSTVEGHYKMSFIQEDALQIMSTVETADINDVNTDYIINDSIYNETLNENDLLIETLSKLWATNGTTWGHGERSPGDPYSRLDNAREIAAAFFDPVLEPRDNFGIFFSNGTAFDEVYSIHLPGVPFTSASDIVNSQQFISGVSKGHEISGYSARAFLQRREKTKVVYFGGYIGDGNTTAILELLNLSSVNNVSFDLATSSPFRLYINNIFIRAVTQYSTDPLIPISFSLSPDEISLANFTNGTNTIVFKNDTSTLFSVSGGYIKASYNSNSPEYVSTKKQYLIGVDGVINEYDSIYSPNTINWMEAKLHYNVTLGENQPNATIVFFIGGIPVYQHTVFQHSNEVTYTISDSNNFEMRSLLGGSYYPYSNVTVPIRLGFLREGMSASGGNADVIVVTDVSGSMKWRMDRDHSTNSVKTPSPRCNETNLSDPNDPIFDPDVKRAVVAMCFVREFISTILNASGNKVGLVSFDGNSATPQPKYPVDTITSYHDLSTDVDSLFTEVSRYDNPTGDTGLCGGLRQARLLLQQQSAMNRSQFILVITDGQQNIQCNETLLDDVDHACTPDRCPVTSYCGANQPDSCTITVLESPDTGEQGLPAIAFRGDKWITISGTQNGEVKGYTWEDERRWNEDSSVVSGITISTNSMVAPAFARDINDYMADFNGDGKKDLIFGLNKNSGGGTYKGYSWNGNDWENNQSLVRGLQGSTGSSVEVRPVFAYNLTGNDKWILLVGREDKSVRGFSWNGTDWVSESSLTRNDCSPSGTADPAIGFNMTGTGKWELICGGGSGGNYNGFYWNGAWVSDSSITTGLTTTGSPGGGQNSLDLVYNIFDETWYGINGVVDSGGSGDRAKGYFSFYWDKSANSWLMICGDWVNERAVAGTVQEADRVHEQSTVNASIYAMGMGPIAFCPTAQYSTKEIAIRTGGEYFLSRNSSKIHDVLVNWSRRMVYLSYAEQRSAIEGNFTSILHPDSYIAYNYSEIDGGFLGLGDMDAETLRRYGNVITMESGYFNHDTGMNNFSYQEGYPLEVVATSYSGPKWSNWLGIDNTSISGTNFVTVYNLSYWGPDFQGLGDPFRINIPISHVGYNNSVKLTISNGSVELNASAADKIFYTILTFSNFSYSNVTTRADGCIWTIQYRDGTNDDNFYVTRVPLTYPGTNECIYSKAYDGSGNPYRCANATNNALQNDAMAQATYLLLRKYDVNPDNCVIDTKLSDYNVNAVLLPSVPFMFYTKANFVSWR